MLFLILLFFTPKHYTLDGHAQGTTWHISYYANDSMLSVRDIDSITSSLDSSLSLYKPYSLINRFNNSINGTSADIHLLTVVKKALEINRETDGAFDITVQPLVEAWGFGVTKPPAPPADSTVKRLLQLVGPDKLILQGGFLQKANPQTRIDLNGIAQGYSVDIIAGFLESKGIKHFLVELGGEIRVKGRRQPAGDPMQVGIETPQDDEFVPAPLRAVIPLTGGGLTSSGNYRKYYLLKGKRISHLISPKTGYPFENELISVTVMAPDAITADGYDNALMGMGLKKAMAFVEAHPSLQAYFIYQDAAGAVKDTSSSKFPSPINPKH